jgi:hypothetical protein
LYGFTEKEAVEIENAILEDNEILDIDGVQDSFDESAMDAAMDVAMDTMDAAMETDSDSETE